MSTRAKKLFTEFHSFDPREIGNFHPSFEIPSFAYMVGDARTMYYRSDKLNPATGKDEGFIEYFHDHEKGVKVYRFDSEARSVGTKKDLPKWIRSCTSLWRIGECKGFDFVALDGTLETAKCQKPYPEWYATPNGKAIFVVENRKTPIALVYGGKLHVEDRGVVG